jgi:hypothetical protein
MIILGKVITSQSPKLGLVIMDAYWTLRNSFVADKTSLIIIMLSILHDWLKTSSILHIITTHTYIIIN